MAKKSVYVEQVHAREEKGRKKWPLVVAGVAVLAVAGGIGSTFAANITINSSSAVEFGQGTQVVSACDSSITTALASKIVSGSFYVDTLKLTGFDTSACAGKHLLIRLADGSNNLLTLGGSSTVMTITVDTLVSSSPLSLTEGTAALASGIITITPASNVSASSVAKVLIETD